VRVQLELLIPGVQHTEEADLRAEKSRIAGHFKQGLGTGAEQQIVEDLLVLQDQWGQVAGKGEDHVHVGRGEKFLLTRSDPPFPIRSLTLRAVAVPTTVIRDGGTISAIGALIDMTAQRGRTTPRNGQQHFDVAPANPRAVPFDEISSRVTNEIGHLEQWPAHLVRLWRLAPEEQGV